MDAGPCTYLDCAQRAKKFIGGCNQCGGSFCLGHRMMEKHKCIKLPACKVQLHERNAEQLLKEATPVVKLEGC